MDMIVKMVGIVGAVFAVRGLFSVLTGAMDFFSGRKNDNPNKVDSGIEAMVSGGVMAAISGSVTAAIIVAIQGISY
jgi:ABC-type phosphate transport system permease subunit